MKPDTDRPDRDRKPSPNDKGRKVDPPALDLAARMKTLLLFTLQVSVVTLVFGFALHATWNDLLYLVRRPWSASSGGAEARVRSPAR